MTFGTNLNAHADRVIRFWIPFYLLYEPYAIKFILNWQMNGFGKLKIIEITIYRFLWPETINDFVTRFIIYLFAQILEIQNLVTHKSIAGH